MAWSWAVVVFVSTAFIVFTPSSTVVRLLIIFLPLKSCDITGEVFGVVKRHTLSTTDIPATAQIKGAHGMATVAIEYP